MPRLFVRLSQASNQVPDEDFIDVDYWADPERNIRRKSGEQEAILTATSGMFKGGMVDAVGGVGYGGTNMKTSTVLIIAVVLTLAVGYSLHPQSTCHSLAIGHTR